MLPCELLCNGAAKRNAKDVDQRIAEPVQRIAEQGCQTARPIRNRRCGRTTGPRQVDADRLGPAEREGKWLKQLEVGSKAIDQQQRGPIAISRMTSPSQLLTIHLQVENFNHGKTAGSRVEHIGARRLREWQLRIADC